MGVKNKKGRLSDLFIRYRTLMDVNAQPPGKIDLFF